MNWLYPSSIAEAKKAQLEMAARVILEDRVETVQTIGGMDVSNNLYDPEQLIYAAAVVLEEGKVIEQSSVKEKQIFPYIPGLLGFREAPALAKAFSNLKKKPDLIMVDGHGVSHPRSLGIASHLGVLLDIPTIGVAKSILVGHLEGMLGEAAGSHAPLVWKGKILAMVYRSKVRARPLIISAGHKISLETAVKFVIENLRGYRLPEPTRQAHLAANACRQHDQSHQSHDKIFRQGDGRKRNIQNRSHAGASEI